MAACSRVEGAFFGTLSEPWSKGSMGSSWHWAYCCSNWSTSTRATIASTIGTAAFHHHTQLLVSSTNIHYSYQAISLQICILGLLLLWENCFPHLPFHISCTSGYMPHLLLTVEQPCTVIKLQGHSTQVFSSIALPLGTTQGSWRPRALSSVSCLSRVTVFCLLCFHAEITLMSSNPNLH